MMHSAQTFSSQQFSQRLVKSKHCFILLFDSTEACKQKLLAMWGRVDKMLKEQRQILYVRLQCLESLIVLSWVRVFGHSENKTAFRVNASYAAGHQNIQ